MLGIKSEKKRFYDKFWFYNFQNTLKKKQTTCFKAKPIFMHFFFLDKFYYLPPLVQFRNN